MCLPKPTDDYDRPEISKGHELHPRTHTVMSAGQLRIDLSEPLGGA